MLQAVTDRLALAYPDGAWKWAEENRPDLVEACHAAERTMEAAATGAGTTEHMTHQKTGDAPDTRAGTYRLTCSRCGGTFLETKDLLFHPCPGEGGSRSTQPRRRRPASRPSRRTGKAQDGRTRGGTA